MSGVVFFGCQALLVLRQSCLSPPVSQPPDLVSYIRRLQKMLVFKAFLKAQNKPPSRILRMDTSSQTIVSILHRTTYVSQGKCRSGPFSVEDPPWNRVPMTPRGRRGKKRGRKMTKTRTFRSCHVPNNVASEVSFHRERAK